MPTVAAAFGPAHAALVGRTEGAGATVAVPGSAHSDGWADNDSIPVKRPTKEATTAKEIREWVTFLARNAVRAFMDEPRWTVSGNHNLTIRYRRQRS